MIAQLMAQRILSLNPDCDGAPTFRQALKLCASPKSTVPQLAGMQAALAKGWPMPSQRELDAAAGTSWAVSIEIADLLQQALGIRRAALAAKQPKVRFNLEARGRLVGA